MYFLECGIEDMYSPKDKRSVSPSPLNLAGNMVIVEVMLCDITSKEGHKEQSSFHLLLLEY